MGGITLSTSPYRFEIASRMKVLKDFFIVVYFVLLGSQISFDGNLNRPFIGAGLAAVIFFKPRITMWLMKLMGHVKKNNFLTGLTLIPMSEFSFILISMGISSGAIKDQNLLVMITIIGITSILISGYATKNSGNGKNTSRVQSPGNQKKLLEAQMISSSSASVNSEAVFMSIFKKRSILF